jgi:hypothetical protein
MVTAKLKLVGVDPSVVGALHEAVKNSKFVAPEGYKSDMNPAHATILDCRLDKEYGTYTVSLDLHLRTECGHAERVTAYPFENPKYFMYQSIGSLRRILQAVDASLLPDEEKPVAADDKTREILVKRAKEAKTKQLNTELCEILKPLHGKSFCCDIVDADGRMILQAGSELDGDRQFGMHTRIQYHGLKLDGVTDERLKAVLQKADDVGKAMRQV